MIFDTMLERACLGRRFSLNGRVKKGRLGMRDDWSCSCELLWSNFG